MVLFYGLDCTVPLTTLLAQSLPEEETFLLENGDAQGLAAKTAWQWLYRNCAKPLSVFAASFTFNLDEEAKGKKKSVKIAL